jgi:hypothetical protein
MDQQVVILYEKSAYLRVLTGLSVINLRVQAEVAPLAPHKPGQPHSR